MKKVLIVPDIPQWAMESMAFGLVNSNLKEKFDLTVKYSDALSKKYGKELIDWESDYKKYDVIYLMASGYLPKDLPDYSKICTTFHGGPGTESQANTLQRMGLTDMRMSFVSYQTLDRVTKFTFSSSEKIDAKILVKEVDGIIRKQIDMDWIKETLAIGPKDSLKLEYSTDFYEMHKKEKMTVPIRARYIKSNGFGLNNLCFTPQGVDLNIYKQDSITNKFVCGYAGWIQYLQGQQEDHRRGNWIINAFNKNEFNLNIAGGLKEIGGAKNRIKKFKCVNNIQINLYNRDDMVDFYKGISCYLVPDRLAGGPLPVLEAGAMGIPVICTNAGHCGDFIQNNVHGKIINTYEDFFKAIDWMKKNPNKRKQMGKNLQEYIRENRTWDVVSSYWEDFFNGV